MSGREKSAPPPSWSRASAQLQSRDDRRQTNNRGHSPVPWSSAQQGVGSSSSSQSNARDSPVRKHSVHLDRSASPASSTSDAQAAYDSDGGLSIPTSFTRSTGVLNVGMESESEDDQDGLVFPGQPSVWPERPSVAQLPAVDHRRRVSESWDDDFEFPQDNNGSSQGTATVQESMHNSLDRNKDASSDEEGSIWDSDGNGQVEEVSSLRPTSTTDRDYGKRLARTASSRTIVPESRAQQDEPLPFNPRTPGNVRHNATQSVSALNLSKDLSKRLSHSKVETADMYRNSAFPSSGVASGSTDKRIRSANLSTQAAAASSGPTFPPRKTSAHHNPPSSNSSPDKPAGQQKDVSNISHKRRSFGLSTDTSWTKIFSSKLGRRKNPEDEPSASLLFTHRESQAKVPTVAEQTRSMIQPLRYNASSSAIETNTAFPVPARNFSAASVPSEARIASTSREDGRLLASRASTRQAPTNDSSPSSERRQWASMLDNGSPPRRPQRNPRRKTNEMPLYAQRRKDSVSHSNGNDVSMDQQVLEGNHSSRPMDAPSERFQLMNVAGRSISESTTGSITSSNRDNSISVASSAMTDITFDSQSAAEMSSKRPLARLRRSSQKSIGPENESMSASSDSRQSRSSRSVSTKGPPPVSSGLDTLARRKASELSKMIPDTSEYVTDSIDVESEARGARKGSYDSAIAQATLRRNSFGDLKIPARISKAQDALRADMMRIRNFANGIEDLKVLREEHEQILDRLSKGATRSTELRRELGDELDRAEFSYSSWWECAEVLIGLADGKEDLAASKSHAPSNERKASMSSQRPRISPTPSERSEFEVFRGTVRRQSGTTANSRASSSASRIIAPDRERDILAAMLNGTPPDRTPPTLTRPSQILHRAPWGEEDATSSPASKTKRRSYTSQRPSMEARRVSDSIRELDVEPSSVEVALSEGPFAAINRSGSTGTDEVSVTPAGSVASHLETSMSRQGSRRRQNLRSAGQVGLQGLRDLIWTIRMNAFSSAKADLVDSPGAITTATRMRRGSKASAKETSQSFLLARVSSHTPNAGQWEGDRPLLNRVPASAPAAGDQSFSELRQGYKGHRRPPYDASSKHALTSRSTSGHSVSGDRSYADSSVDLSIESQWTEANPDLSYQSTNVHSPTTYNEERTSHTSPQQLEYHHQRTPSVLSRALPNAVRRDRFISWLNLNGASNTKRLATLKNKSEASLPQARRMGVDDGFKGIDVASPRSPVLISIETASTDSVPFETLVSRGRRLRVMSADHFGSAAHLTSAASSEAYRKLAMRPEAMPSLNRYLDTTRIRCRESLTILKDLDERARS